MGSAQKLWEDEPPTMLGRHQRPTLHDLQNDQPTKVGTRQPAFDHTIPAPPESGIRRAPAALPWAAQMAATLATANAPEVLPFAATVRAEPRLPLSAPSPRIAPLPPRVPQFNLDPAPPPASGVRPVHRAAAAPAVVTPVPVRAASAPVAARPRSSRLLVRMCGGFAVGAALTAFLQSPHPASGAARMQLRRAATVTVHTASAATAIVRQWTGA